MSNPTNINFWSEKNYMKRDVSTDSQSLVAPTVSAFGGFVFTTTVIIPHNLNIVPFFNIFYEPFSDNIIWEPMGTRLNGSITNPNNPSGAAGPYLMAWADSINLTIELGYLDNSLTGNFPVYYVIYKDYGLTQ